MGFWQVTKRILQGKPGFEPKVSDEWDDDNPTIDFSEDREAKRAQVQVNPNPNTLYDNRGYKHPPVAEVINVKDDFNGHIYELWVTIKNQSDREIKLDKITILGARAELDYRLPAHEQRVFRAFHGDVPTHDHYKKAELYYMDCPSGDYFRADHMIRYHYDPHGTYDIIDLNLCRPIYDI